MPAATGHRAPPALFDKLLLIDAVERAGTPFCVTDSSGEIVYVNDALCAIVGYDQDELLGNPISLLKSGNTPDSVYRQLWTTIASGKTWSGQISNRKKDGQIYVQSLYIAPLAASDRRPRHYIATWQDITERERELIKLRRDNQALRDTETDYEEYVARAAHDLRTPVSQIASITDYLAHVQGGQDPSSNQMLQILHEAANRMNDLIDATLDLARIRDGHINSVPVELAATLDLVRLDSARAIADAGARIEIRPLPTVQGDPILLYELFANLLGNALKYRHPKRPLLIQVSSRSVGPRAEIILQDNGRGIPVSQQETIFKPFERAHGDSVAPGVGMGLAICRKIARQHHGDIRVESIPTHGSAFIVALPANPH